MDAHGYTEMVARATDEDRSDVSVLGTLNSGYVLPGNDRAAAAGNPQAVEGANNYLRDAAVLRYGPIEDGVLSFRRVATGSPASERLEAITGG